MPLIAEMVDALVATGMSRGDIASRAGCSRPHLWRLVNGAVAADSRKALQVAEALSGLTAERSELAFGRLQAAVKGDLVRERFVLQMLQNALGLIERLKR